MNQTADIKKALSKLTAQRGEYYSLLGKVLSVDKTNNTVDVSPLNSAAEVLNVRLNTLQGSSKGIVIYPKVGSTVSISFLDKNNAFVALYNEIESVNVQIEQHNILFDKKGIKAKSQSADLNKTLNSFIGVVDSVISILTEFQLATNVGPTIAVMPHLTAKLQSEKTKLSKMKSDINTIIQ